MKIATGTIIFNGETLMPEGMLKAQLEQLYYIGDEIFIVDGATKCRDYFDGDTSFTGSHGSSTDNTINIIKNFPDPENKIKLIEANGFWNGKTSMCNEWAKNMTSDYIWQIDGDEFYHKEDIDKIKTILKEEAPDAVHFYANHFFGSFKSCMTVRSGGSWGNNIPWMRIFKHQPGSYWHRHEPPTYITEGKDCNEGKVLQRHFMLDKGILMYHYSYVTEEQIIFKEKFYHQENSIEYYNNWKKYGNSASIFRAHTEDFNGPHPIWIQDVVAKYSQ